MKNQNMFGWTVISLLVLYSTFGASTSIDRDTEDGIINCRKLIVSNNGKTAIELSVLQDGSASVTMRDNRGISRISINLNEDQYPEVVINGVQGEPLFAIEASSENSLDIEVYDVNMSRKFGFHSDNAHVGMMLENSQGVNARGIISFGLSAQAFPYFALSRTALDDKGVSNNANVFMSVEKMNGLLKISGVDGESLSLSTATLDPEKDEKAKPFTIWD